MRRSRAELPFGSGSHHIVGGFLELTTLDQAGARQRIVRSWQDRLGEPITPGPRR
jgi:hypothetical protein